MALPVIPQPAILYSGYLAATVRSTADARKAWTQQWLPGTAPYFDPVDSALKRSKATGLIEGIALCTTFRVRGSLGTADT